MEYISYIYDVQKTIQADTLLFCPNKAIPNTEYLKDFNDSVEFDVAGHVQTDHFCRSSVKRIFAAGSCSSQEYFVTNDRVIL